MSSTLPCYKTGGSVKKAACGGKMKSGGEVKKASGGSLEPEKKLVKKAIGQHDKNMHGGKTEKLELKKGGASQKRMAKKAEGGPMMSKPAPAAKPMKASAPAKKKSMKAKAPSVKKEASMSKEMKSEVPVLGSPDAMAPPDLGSMQAPMMKHGGTVHHVHTMANGGGVERHMDGGPAGMGAAPNIGQGMASALDQIPAAPAAAPQDPRLAALKRRLQMMGQTGGAGAGGGGSPGAGAPPMGMPPQGAM